MLRHETTDDRDAFRALFEAQKQTIFRFLFRLTGHRHDAEDLVQETFARYWTKRRLFRGDGAIEGFLRQIAYRSFLNARARLSRQRAATRLDAEPAGREPGPEERALLEDESCRLRAAIDGLPDAWREPFLLFRFEGLRVKEIAALMGATPKAIELRIGRALRRVSENLLDLTPDPEDVR